MIMPRPFTIIGSSLPSLLLIAAFIVMLLPWQISEFSPIKPNLPIIVLFFWTYIRPERLPSVALFIGAFLTDIFMPVPLGYHCLLYFIINGLMLWRSMRLTRPSFLSFYLEFATLSAVFYILSSLFNQFTDNAFAIGINVAFAWAMTLGAFGIIFPLLNWVYHLHPSHSADDKEARDVRVIMAREVK